MKLYTYNSAPNPRRLNLFLAWKGIELPVEQVDLRQQGARAPEFLARNPRGIVPALELEDGEILCDALAIALYLEGLFPQKALFGGSALERARIVSWDQYIFNDAFSAVAEMLRNSHPAFADRALPGPHDVPQIPALVERGRARLQNFFADIEKQVDARKFLVGTTLSWADICLSVVIDFAGWVQFEVPEECAAVRGWQERTKALLAPLEKE